MPIKLNIEIQSPLDPRDHELLSGIAVMVLAIANHELAEQRFPEAFAETPPEEVDPGEAPLIEASPAPCGSLSGPPDYMACVSKAGHRGRHAMRPIPVLAN